MKLLRLIPIFALLVCFWSVSIFSPGYVRDFESSRFTLADPGERLWYRQISPDTLDSEKLYPLVIFLHGYGERGDDNSSHLRICGKELHSFIKAEMEDLFVLMPQCPDDMRWVRYMRPIGSPPHKMDKYPTLPQQLVEKLIEEKMATLPIDPERIYIGGFSMGGFGAMELLVRRPDLFAGGISICAGGDPNMVEHCKAIPIWLFHGTEDSIVVPEYSQATFKALRSYGSSTAKLSMLPGTGHDAWRNTCKDADVWKWLLKQKKTDSHSIIP